MILIETILMSGKDCNDVRYNWKLLDILKRNCLGDIHCARDGDDDNNCEEILQTADK
jgi:hypothetical protein